MADDLRREMKAGFKKVDGQFKKVDEQFKKVDRQFKKVDERFNKVDDEFVAVRTEMQAIRAELKAEIRSDGETTRRHFDVVAEQFKEYVKVLADGTARNTEPALFTNAARSFITRRRQTRFLAAAGFDTALRAVLKTSPGRVLSEGPKIRARVEARRADYSGLHE